MGTVSDFIAQQTDSDYHADNTIFVAVGKNVDKCKTTLFWALQSFLRKKICLLHVHQPANAFSLTDKRFALGKPKQEMLGAFREVEKKKMFDVLNEYCHILAREGVQANTVWIEMDSVEKGIVEIISQCSIRWLVMGAAADKYYSKKLTGLKSKKAVYVCQHAPISCHIWFSCKGCLIYTRESRIARSEKEIALPLLLLDSDLETQHLEQLRVGSFTQTCRSIEKCSVSEEDADDLEGISGSLNLQCLVHSTESINAEFMTSKLIHRAVEEEEKAEEQEIERPSCLLGRAISNVKDSKKKACEEAVKRWKDEDDAMEAKCKAKALENLCVKEMSLRKEMEEELTSKRQEVERTKNQRDELTKELQMIQDQLSVLESQFTESNCTVTDLEDKIISAVELLISFRGKRDEARTEYENSITEVNRLRRLAKMETVRFCWSEILEFSFMEINQATQEFDPSWKIGEGKYGIIYKGVLRHAHVAIKMLPSYGPQSLIHFQNGVEVLSRVRHPHLVILIGTCPESRSLVYEYVTNGSLEDCLAGKNKKPPLSWQTRIRIATEICSALIFLHSKKPCMIHGNLKPSKVLLDGNYISKLNDFGVSHLIPQSEKTRNTNPSFTTLYTDPEYIKTGVLTPQSDIYSFGMILLQLLTGRPVSGLIEDVKCALGNENLDSLLDWYCSSGEWQVEQAKLLAKLALRCCESSPLRRPDLVSEIWSILEPLRASCVDSASCFISNSEKLHQIPSHFVCPIFQEVMKDPQIAADGFTYDAEAIEGWLKSGRKTSPMTNLKLEHCDLLPNHALYQAIQDWQQRC